MRQRIEDEIDGHLKAHRRGFADVAGGPFPAVADVLVVADHHHHAPVVVEEAVVGVVVGVEPGRLAGLDFGRDGGHRVDVVVDGPDGMLRR